MRHKSPNVVASVSLHNSSDVSAQVQAGQADIRICRRAGCAVGARVVRSSAVITSSWLCRRDTTGRTVCPFRSRNSHAHRSFSENQGPVRA